MENFAAEEKLTILMDLLDEHDEPVYDKISDSILSFGVSAIPFLEKTRENVLDNIVQSRIKLLIHRIRFQNLYFELHNWATLNSKDLLKGFLLISKYLFPDIDEERVMAQVESLKREIWLELKTNMTPFQEAKVISKMLFEVNKFKLNSNVACFPDSMCLNILLDSRKGFPLALSVLYAGLAQRLGFSIYGVNMPDTMFLAYVYSNNPSTCDFQKDVLFYLNPFAAGTFFTNLDVKEFLAKHYSTEKKEYCGACKNPRLILQIAKTMQYAFLSFHNSEKADELSVLMEALDVE